MENFSVKTNLLFIFIFTCFFAVSCKKTPSFTGNTKDAGKHSLLTELELLYNVGRLPQYLDSSTVSQVSTYDTTGGNDDGFNGRYSYLSRNADSSLVIFDVKGGGVINRIWTPTPSNDTLDFYLDGSAKPVLSIMYYDLFSGKSFPFLNPLCGNELGGYYCYFPIPFEKSCKIVFRGKKIQFHQIQYRNYPEGTAIRSFSPDLAAEEKESLVKIAMLWNKPERTISDFTDQGEFVSDSKTIAIKPGETKTVFSSNEGGRILGLEFEPAGVFESPEKPIDIRITWDDEMTPAVYCPLSDFFGYSFGVKSMQSLLIGSRNNICYSYIPMPFDKSAKIELVYRKVNSTSPVSNLKIKSIVHYSSEKRNSRDEGKLYTSWHRQLYSELGKPFVFSDINGKGHFFGTILQAQGLRPGMTLFFEGDDSTSIDGTPRIHGTGSEDYFNGGWYAFLDCWDTKFSLPLHGSLEYSLPYCRTGGYRFYLSDKLSFEKSFFHSIEHGAVGNRFPVDYTSLSFFYCNSPFTNSTNPENTISKVFTPDTLVIYPQLMSYNIWEDIACKSLWAYNTGGMSFIFTLSNETKIRISLEDIQEGKYDLYVDFEKNKSGCELSFWQRQTKISDWISSNGIEKERVSNQFISQIDVNDFNNTLTLKFKTEKGNNFFFNRLVLIRKP